MKMNFESQPHNNENRQEELPSIDQGEIVNPQGLANYYERIMDLKERHVNADAAEKERIEKEIMALQNEMKESTTTKNTFHDSNEDESVAA